MTIQPTYTPPSPPFDGAASAGLARAAEPAAPPRGPACLRAARVPSLCALLCVGSLWAAPAPARPPRAAAAPRPPSTAEILAPSARATPDALPDERVIYRCGNRYSPQRCAGAKPLQVDDPRSAGQRAQALELVGRDQRLAAWLDAQRREREAPAAMPKKARKKSARGCVESAAIACAAKPPRPRRVVARAASAPASPKPK